MGFQIIYVKGPHQFQRSGSRAAHRRLAISGLMNRLNYCCVIFTVRTQFGNVATSHIVHAYGPLGGDPGTIYFYFYIHLPKELSCRFTHLQKYRIYETIFLVPLK